MRPLPVLPVLVVLLLLVLLPSPPAWGAPDKEWTLLVYMDADNNLEDVAIEDFLEMAAVGSTPEVSIVVQMDRTPGEVSTYGDWTTAKRFYVTAGMAPDPASALLDLGEANMADPATLEAFVNWGIGNYPAQHYFLALWDHGDGWQGVVLDSDPVAGDRLNATELRTAMDGIVTANGRRIDLLGVDACRMTLEIQYELAPFVDYFVGSEKDEPKEGWPYTPFLQALTADPTMAAVEVASTLVDAFVEDYENVSLYSVALSVVNAAGLRPLVASLNAFLEDLAAHEPYFRDEVVAARAATEHYEDFGDDYDLWDFVENLLARIPSPRLARSAADLFSAFGGAVVYERHWDNPSPTNGVHAANAHGMSLFFPPVWGGLEYAQLALSRDSAWDEFLATYALGSRPRVALWANATSEDTNADGRRDTLVLAYTPAANGTVQVDVYREAAYLFSREYAGVGNRTDEVRYPSPLGGLYRIGVYLLVGGKIQNLTLAEDLPIEELIAFRGNVTGPGGARLDGALVTVTNLRTNASVSATASAGAYEILVVFPTWFRAGDPLRLEVSVGDRRASVTFDAPLPMDGVIVQDVTLDTAGMGLWYGAVGALVVLAAVGFALALLFRRRARKSPRIP